MNLFIGLSVGLLFNPVALGRSKSFVTNLSGSVRKVANLSYKILGENTTQPEEPPILILHGLLSNKRLWTSISKTILNMTKKSVVVVDLRNHGGSPHKSSHKYKNMAADVFKLYEKLKIKKANVIGHNMGGRTAMCMSLLMPEKVSGLLVIDISPVSSPVQMKKDIPKILAAMKDVKFKYAKKVNKTKKDVRRQLKQVITDDVMMNTVLSNINVKPNGTIGWTCNLDVLIKYYKHIASFPFGLMSKKYLGPVLFIGGQLSDYIPPDDLNDIREMFPRAVIKYIPKTGHDPQVDDPKSFMELVISFMKLL